MFVDAGLNEMRNLMSSGTGTAPTHIELGSAVLTPAAGDTTLAGSYFRKAFTSNTVADKTNKYECLFLSTEANGGSIRGMGVFNAVSAGDMFSESGFPLIVKDASIEIQFDVEYKYADT